MGAAVGVEEERHVRREGRAVGAGGDEEGEALPPDQGVAPGVVGGIEVLRHVHDVAPRRGVAYTALRGSSDDHTPVFRFYWTLSP